MKHLLPAILALTPLLIHAQENEPADRNDTIYTQQQLHKSTSFAWTTFGSDLLIQGSGRADYLNPAGDLTDTRFGVSPIPRLTIGGIHFWGHADFYVTFPLPVTLVRRPAAFADWRYRNGIETGARVYPFRLRPGRVSPYAGISLRQLSYGHQSAGTTAKHGFPAYQRWVSPLQLGVTYTSSGWLFTAGLHYLPGHRFTYAISPTQRGNVTLSPLSFNVGLVRYIDTDRAMALPENVQQENAKLALLKKHRRLSAWYLGIGPSAGLEISRSSYIAMHYPYLNDDQSGGFMPDITFGRYLNKPDLNIGLSYRTLGSRQLAFDTRLHRRRHSFMIEGYKFLADYHGFVPYLGPTLSAEFLSFSDNGRRIAETRLAVGVIAGWDIRVTRTGTSLLRTNLRWIPNLHLKAEDKKVMFDHLEFNFIQWVHFFGRGKIYQANRK